MIAAINRALDEGTMHGLGMNVDDCRTTCEELKAKGVTFIQEPEELPYGVEAVARDNSGNWMVLVEPRALHGRRLQPNAPSRSRKPSVAAIHA